MDLYIIKRPHTHTHTHTHGQQLHCIFSTQQDTLSCLSELTRFIWRQKQRPWRRSLHMVIPFHPHTSTRSLTLSVTAPVYIRVNKRWRRTGESESCVNGGEESSTFCSSSRRLPSRSANRAQIIAVLLCADSVCWRSELSMDIRLSWLNRQGRR